jgi:hypothetical protein
MVLNGYEMGLSVGFAVLFWKPPACKPWEEGSWRISTPGELGLHG